MSKPSSPSLILKHSEKQRYLNRLPVREQRQRLVAVLRKPIAEFLEQHGVGVEHVRHARETHRHAAGYLLIQPQQPHRKGAGPEIFEALIDATTAATRAASAGDCRSIRSSVALRFKLQVCL